MFYNKTNTELEKERKTQPCLKIQRWQKYGGMRHLSGAPLRAWEGPRQLQASGFSAARAGTPLPWLFQVLCLRVNHLHQLLAPGRPSWPLLMPFPQSLWYQKNKTSFTFTWFQDWLLSSHQTCGSPCSLQRNIEQALFPSGMTGFQYTDDNRPTGSK